MTVAQTAEFSEPTPIHGLGRQLRGLAADPRTDFYFDQGVVRLAEASAYAEPPLFLEVQQETCATSGVAQVLYFPRHLRREG